MMEPYNISHTLIHATIDDDEKKSRLTSVNRIMCNSRNNKLLYNNFYHTELVQQ